MLKWIEKISIQKNKNNIIAISHKDPIIILILYFMKKNINDISKIKLNTGGVVKINFDDEILIQPII